jgi:hypothetical protein
VWVKEREGGKRKLSARSALFCSSTISKRKERKREEKEL